MALGNSILRLINKRVRAGKDSRVLQMLPDRVLADMGLQRVEITAGTSGSRQSWVIPQRDY